MPRTLVESPLTTPSARKRLPVGLHWRRIDGQVHLGYRRGIRSGVWLVRWRLVDAGYKHARLGEADDERAGAISFAEAERMAREHVAKVMTYMTDAKDTVPRTVREAVEQYSRHRDAIDTSRSGRDGKRSDATQRLERYLLGRPSKKSKDKGKWTIEPAPLSQVELATLRERHLAEWRRSLPSSLRRTTIQRLVNDLRAALNRAFDEHDHLQAPIGYGETVRRGLRLSPVEGIGGEIARAGQILPDGDVLRLVSAALQIDRQDGWDGDLHRLVAVLAISGMRFAQVARIKVGDVDLARRRILVPRSRKGSNVDGQLAGIAVQFGPDIAAALSPAIVGRAHDDILLERWRYKQVAVSEWERSSRGAWVSASELSRPWAKIRELAGLAPQVVPYSLRHSSIVRMIRKNKPLRLIAARHNTSVPMIEKHYAAFVVDGLEDMLADTVISVVADEQNVISLTR